MRQYDKATWLHGNDGYEQAEDVLYSIPSDFSLTQAEEVTHDAYLELYPIATQILDDTLRVLPVDNLVESALQNLAILETSLPGAYARNLLIASGDTLYQEPIILPDEGLKQSNRIKFRGVKELNANQPFTIFPNPAHDYFILKKNLPEMETSGIIRIVDQNGIIVKSLGYDNKADQILIKTTSLNPGVYLIRISNGTRQVSVLKLAIL